MPDRPAFTASTDERGHVTRHCLRHRSETPVSSHRDANDHAVGLDGDPDVSDLASLLRLGQTVIESPRSVTRRIARGFGKRRTAP